MAQNLYVMKQIIKLLTIISVFFMFDNFELSAQSYEQMWSKLETFDKDDLPKQVIGQAERIYDKARKDRNFAQMLKAWEYLVEKNHQIYWDDIAMFCHFDDFDLGIIERRSANDIRRNFKAY